VTVTQLNGPLTAERGMEKVQKMKMNKEPKPALVGLLVLAGSS